MIGFNIMESCVLWSWVGWKQIVVKFLKRYVIAYNITEQPRNVRSLWPMRCVDCNELTDEFTSIEYLTELVNRFRIDVNKHIVDRLLWLVLWHKGTDMFCVLIAQAKPQLFK